MIYHTFTIFNEIAQYKIIFGFIKKIFITAMTFYSCNAMKCVSMKNQECNVRPVIMNKTWHIRWHGTCNCKYRLDESVSNNKQCWNNDK